MNELFLEHQLWRQPGALFPGINAEKSRALNDSSFVDVALAEARIIRPTEPSRAIGLLNHAIEFLERNQRTADIVELYLERARAHRATAREDRWTSDLLRAVAVVEERRDETENITFSDQYIAAEREAYVEATDALLETAQAERAFAVADRGRGRILRDPTLSPVTVHSVRASLAPGSLLVHYTVVQDEAIVFWITRDASGDARVPFDERRPDALVQPFASQLPRILKLVIVPDRPLYAVPFALLRDPGSGRKLLDEVAIVIAPSAAFYVRSQRVARQRRVTNALIVGDPAFDQKLFPNLPRLPAAAAEANEIAALYRTATVLTGRSASARQFLSDAAAADVIHIGSHAELGASDASAAALLLAPAPAHSGALTLRTIRDELSPRDRLVVLAACRTGVNQWSAVENFAFAFLSTGSTTVIGTIRDVPDYASRFFSVTLHRLIHQGKEPAEAVRETQLAMASSRDPALSEPETWSAFQVYGSGD